MFILLFAWQLYTRLLFDLPVDTKNELTREDTMVSHERILWSHMRGYYGLTREDTMASHERILWSHTRGYYGLIREDTMVSYERILWSHMRGYYGLI